MRPLKMHLLFNIIFFSIFVSTLGFEAAKNKNSIELQCANEECSVPISSASALTNYVPNEEWKVGLKPGEKVSILGESNDKDGLYLIQGMDGKKGLFPSKHLKVNTRQTVKLVTVNYPLNSKKNIEKVPEKDVNSVKSTRVLEIEGTKFPESILQAEVDERTIAEEGEDDELRGSMEEIASIPENDLPLNSFKNSDFSAQNLTENVNSLNLNGAVSQTHAENDTGSDEVIHTSNNIERHDKKLASEIVPAKNSEKSSPSVNGTEAPFVAVQKEISTNENISDLNNSYGDVSGNVATQYLWPGRTSEESYSFKERSMSSMASQGVNKNEVSNEGNTSSEEVDGPSRVTSKEKSIGSTPSLNEGDIPSATSPKDGDMPPLTSLKEGDTPSATSPKDGDMPPLTSLKEGDTPSATSPKEGDMPSATSPKEGDISSATSPKEGDIPSATSPKKEDKPSATSTKEGDMPSATSPKEGDTPATSPREGDIPSATPQKVGNASLAPQKEEDTLSAPASNEINSSLALQKEEHASLAISVKEEYTSSQTSPKGGDTPSAPQKEGDTPLAASLKDEDQPSVPPSKQGNIPSALSKEDDIPSAPQKGGDTSSTSQKGEEASSASQKERDTPLIASSREGNTFSVSPSNEIDSPSVLQKEGRISFVIPPKEGYTSSPTSPNEEYAPLSTSPKERDTHLGTSPKEPYTSPPSSPEEGDKPSATSLKEGDIPSATSLKEEDTLLASSPTEGGTTSADFQKEIDSSSIFPSQENTNEISINELKASPIEESPVEGSVAEAEDSQFWFSSIISVVGSVKELLGVSQPPSGDSASETFVFENEEHRILESNEQFCEANQLCHNTGKDIFTQKLPHSPVGGVKSSEESSSYNTDFFNNPPSLSTIVFLTISAIIILLFSLGHYYLDGQRRDAELILKINKLSGDLFVAQKELQNSEEQLLIAQENLSRMSFQTSGSEELVENLKRELDENRSIRIGLENEIKRLETEIESLVESGNEMHRMLTESFSEDERIQGFLSNIAELKSVLSTRLEEIGVLTNQLDIEKQKVDLLTINLRKEEDKRGAIESRLENALFEMDSKVLTVTKEFEEKITHLERILEEKSLESTNLESEISRLKRENEALSRESELCRKELKKVHKVGSTVALEEWMNVQNVHLQISEMEKKVQNLEEERNGAKNRIKNLEEREKEVLGELETLNNKYEEAEKEKIEALTKLQVLSNYFKEKEIQLQEELGTKEAQWLQKQSEDHTIYEQMRSLREENLSYKAQNEALKKEILDQEASFKIQIANEEQKSQENWVNLRHTERRLKELQIEAAHLRNRLSSIESNSDGFDDKHGKGEILNGGPGDLGGSGVPTSPPFMLYPHDFIPPPPLISPSRPPPLGRISSPPLTPPPPLSPYDLPAMFPPPLPSPPVPHSHLVKPLPTREHKRKQKDSQSSNHSSESIEKQPLRRGKR